MALVASAGTRALLHAGESPATPLQVWRLEEGRLVGQDEGERPLPVGSLAKPFVAKAWAASHPGQPTPRLQCTGGSSCWLPAGHGPLGLAGAVAVSCNAYFRALADATPPPILRSVFREEGFLVPSPLTPDAAIGGEGLLAITPRALLRAYARLTREPWAQGQAVRAEVLAGLRENPLRGTARGLGRFGLWAKTGTVPALDGRPLHTSGLVVTVDDAGRATLGVLTDGTGREAAKALARFVARPGPQDLAVPAPPRSSKARWAGAPERLTVALLGGLRPRVVVARNLGEHPLRTSRGYLGPGASASLRPGDQLAEGLWRLSLPNRRFYREVAAAVSCGEGPGGTLLLRAEMPLPEYVAGVVNAELPEGTPDLRVTLGAAVLRFLSDGPRHGATDVCDSTHCAWFIGRGPSVSWRTATDPVLFTRKGTEEEVKPFAPALWEAITRAAREPGPHQWTSDCGGQPLSPHAVWGNGDRRVWACRLHLGASAPWSRRWRDADMARVFGGNLRTLALSEPDGVWKLVVETTQTREALSYDDAHRRLAETLGWAALPSPAATLVREAGGYRVEGVGLGHRVGLCLGQGGARAHPEGSAAR